VTDLFLDCEWADVFATELVSIALVSMDGKKQFYAEREVLPADPTPWVVAVVLPLLERGDRAKPDAAITRELRAFVAGIDHPRICYDFAADRELCQRVLEGTGAPPTDGLEPLLDSVRWHLMTDTGAALERWWSEHPAERRRHHALADAKALRAAWLSLWGA
jgi:hypothetical protein